jgi:UDP-N-acetylmuramate dehydrogenase
MSFPDLTPDLQSLMPEVQGRVIANQPLAPFTWFRVGGPAQIFFQPADEDDLSYFLSRLPAEIPVTIIGLGSNLIVRDGGVPGVVIRLGGKAFGEIEILPDNRLRAGTAVPDMKAARAAAEAGLDGLAFLRGIPGSIGGALRMNAGAHGGETTDVLIEARGVGIVPHATLAMAQIDLIFRSAPGPDSVERLPDPEQTDRLSVCLPQLTLWPFEPAALAKLSHALAHLGDSKL